MSRSKKKQTYSYWCCGSPSEDKRINNRIFRRKSNQVTRDMLWKEDILDYVIPMKLDDVMDVWSWNVDGKKHWFDLKDLEDFYREYHHKQNNCCLHQIMMK